MMQKNPAQKAGFFFVVANIYALSGRLWGKVGQKGRKGAEPYVHG
ncbi:hypothetical protein MALU111345_12190 [Marinicrinis lubricantis]